MKSSNRKIRSDKFPLTLHPSGHYCKKIKGHIYYFGSDRKQALENYLDQAIFLHGYNNAMQKSVNGNMTLEQFKFSCTVFRYGMHEYISYRIKTAGCRRS